SSRQTNRGVSDLHLWDWAEHGQAHSRADEYRSELAGEESYTAAIERNHSRHHEQQDRDRGRSAPGSAGQSETFAGDQVLSRDPPPAGTACARPADIAKCPDPQRPAQNSGCHPQPGSQSGQSRTSKDNGRTRKRDQRRTGKAESEEGENGRSSG